MGISAQITLVVLFALSIGYAIGVVLLNRGMNSASGMTIPAIENDNELPDVTVIIPARNEVKNIGHLIKNLKEQDYPSNKVRFSIIDDFSDDGTGDKGKKLTGDDKRFEIILLSEQKGFIAESALTAKKRAVDFGVRNAETDIVLFTDADCSFGPRWVRSMVSQLSGEYSIAAGFVGYRYNSILKGVLALESLANRIIAAGAIGSGGAITCAGGNFGYKKELYLKSGGLGRSGGSFSGDDTLFLQSAVYRNAAAVYNFDRDSYVYTSESGNLTDILTRRIRRLGITTQFKPDILLASALLFLYCWILSLTPIIIISVNSLAVPLLTAWIWKLVFDYWILRNGAGKFNSMHLLKFFPVTAIAYPYYISIIGTLSLFLKGSWKGRTS